MIEPPRTVEGIELVIRGDRSRKYRIVLFETIQIQLMEWWKKGVDWCQRIGDWAVHIFREHKEADLWEGFGTKGHSKEWKDESAIDWTKVTGICGFWDGSCNDKICGASIAISFFTQGLGWVIRYKNADQWKVPTLWMLIFWRCAMLIESLKIWMRKCGKSS